MWCNKDISEATQPPWLFLLSPASNVFLLSYLPKSLGSVETQSTFILPWVLGSDCLYPCVLDALWVSQKQTVRAGTDAKFKSRQGESHKLPSMQCWNGSMLISIPIHCGFIAYLSPACGKHFPNNIYISHALACGSFSLVLLVNAVFGLGSTLVMTWSLPCNAAPIQYTFRSGISTALRLISPIWDWYRN